MDRIGHKRGFWSAKIAAMDLDSWAPADLPRWVLRRAIKSRSMAIVSEDFSTTVRVHSVQLNPERNRFGRGRFSQRSKTGARSVCSRHEKLPDAVSTRLRDLSTEAPYASIGYVDLRSSPSVPSEPLCSPKRVPIEPQNRVPIRSISPDIISRSSTPASSLAGQLWLVFSVSVEPGLRRCFDG